MWRGVVVFVVEEVVEEEEELVVPLFEGGGLGMWMILFASPFLWKVEFVNRMIVVFFV
jgi:hypothetical protein